MDAAAPNAARPAAGEGPRKSYDAFISYSHDADKAFAPVLQRGLQQLAKPWHRRRAMEVFRDQTSLAARPGLWPGIQEALDASRWFVLLASPEAARSRWVGKEITYWVSRKGTGHLLVVVTDGTWAWDDSGDLNPASTACHPVLRGVFAIEPMWLDMTWARRDAGLTPRNSARFRDQVATLAAAIRGVPKDDIEGEDVRQHRQARRTAKAVGAALMTLFLLALVLAVAVSSQHREAVHQSQQAIRQREIKASDELAAQSEQLDSADPTTAAKLAAASWRIAPTSQALQSMLDVLAQPERAAVAITNQHLGIARMSFAGRSHVLIIGGGDGRIRKWDVATRRQIGSPFVLVRNPMHYGGPPGPSVPVMAFSPGGDVMATEGADSKVHLWDLASRRELGVPVPGGGGGGVMPLLFSPDGRTLAITSSQGILLLDVASRKITKLAVSDDTMAFSPDGTILATSAGGMLRLWNLATGRELSAPVRAVDRASAPLLAIAFSPRGKILATGGGDGKLRLWSVPGLQEIGGPMTAGTGQSDDYVSMVTFSPDGKLVATGAGNGTVRLWSVATHQRFGQTLTGNIGGPEEVHNISSVLFSPDGKILVTAADDGTLRLWDPSVYQQIGSPIPAAGTNLTLTREVAFSPDGKLIATGADDQTIRLWHVASHRQAGQAITDPGGAMMLTFSPDGRLLAAGESDGKVRLWSLATRRPIEPPIAVSVNNGLASMAFSPRGTILATGERDGKVRLWNVATRTPIGPPLAGVSGGADQSAAVASVAFSPDGRLLATGRENGKVRIYSVAARKPVGSPIAAVDSGVISDLGVPALAFSPDGSTLATADGDGTARLWDVASDQEVGPPMTTTKTTGGGLTSVAFTHGGSILITGDRNGAVKLWDTATFQEIGPAITVPGTHDSPLAMAVSPNGETLATVDDIKGTAQLWNIKFPADLLHAVCAIAGSPLTKGEWNSYIHSQPYEETCQ